MNKQGEKAKRSIDWEAVEREYRAGMLSIREIARLHDVSDKAIRNKANAHGWERDLSTKVAEKVRNELVRAESAASPQNEKNIVETAAAMVVQVVRSHRKKISKGQELVDLLADQLMDVAGNRSMFEDAIETLCAEDDNPKRLQMMTKAVSLEKHAAIALNLANAAKTWIGLERQAFNIADAIGEGPVEMTEEARLKRIAELEAKMRK
jgi:hypothetical protein